MLSPCVVGQQHNNTQQVQTTHNTINKREHIQHITQLLTHTTTHTKRLGANTRNKLCYVHTYITHPLPQHNNRKHITNTYNYKQHNAGPYTTQSNTSYTIHIHTTTHTIYMILRWVDNNNNNTHTTKHTHNTSGNAYITTTQYYTHILITNTHLGAGTRTIVCFVHTHITHPILQHNTTNTMY